jgi:hypothetical protein
MEITNPEFISSKGPKFVSHGELKFEVPQSPEFNFEQNGARFVVPKPLELVLPEKKRNITEIIITQVTSREFLNGQNGKTAKR